MTVRPAQSVWRFSRNELSGNPGRFNTESNRDLRWAPKSVPAAFRSAKIDDFRFHDLRLTLKELGGWKSLPMVQRYAHLSPSHRRTAIERLVTRPVLAKPAKATGAE
jgi:hypothetical protein